MIKFIAIINLIFCSFNAYACLDALEIEKRHQAKALCHRFSTVEFASSDHNEDERQFQYYINHFSYDEWFKNMLERSYANLLLSEKKLGEALMVLALPMIERRGDDRQKNTFMQFLPEYSINGTVLHTHIDFDRLGDNIVTPRRSRENEKSIKEDTKKLFNLLRQLPSNDLYEATLAIVLNHMMCNERTVLAANVVEMLYEEHKDFSPLLRERYAYLCLLNPPELHAKAELPKQSRMRRSGYKNIELVIPIYESILKTNLASHERYKIFENYYILGVLYFIKKDYQNSIDTFRKALEIQTDDANTLHDLAVSLIFYNEYNEKDCKMSYYQEAVDIFRSLLDYSPTLAESKEIRHTVETNYKVALQKAGGQENLSELQKLIERNISQAFERKKRQRLHITKAIEATQQLEEQAKKSQQSIEADRKKNTTSKEDKKVLENKNSGHSLESYSTPAFLHQKHESLTPQLAKEKMKTRGNSALPDKEMIDQHSQTAPKITIAMLLRQNSNPYKVFCKFFERYENPPIMDNKIKISLNDVNVLMDALNQDFDSSKGAGSHTKITLNFKDFGINEREQMIILSHQTYLIADQIKNIREVFLQLGLYPHHLEEELKKKKLIK